MEPNRAVKHEDSDWHTCAGRRPMVSAPAYWQASPMTIPNTPEAAASQNKCSDGSHQIAHNQAKDAEHHARQRLPDEHDRRYPHHP